MAALAALVVCAAVPAAATAAVNFSLVQAPSSIQLPGSQMLTYKIRMVSGADPERFSVSVGSPRFGGLQSIEGATLGESGRPTLIGPGSFGFGMVSSPSLAGCSGINQPGYHGSSNGVYRTNLELPPFSDSVLVFNLNTAAAAPWPGNSYAPTFFADPDLVGPGVGTLPAVTAIKAPEPALAGPSGVRIDFHTSPASAPPPIGFGGPRTIREGKRIKIKGSTSPVLNRQFVQIYALGPITSGSAPAKQELLAKVRTNHMGHFVYRRWKPTKPGFYEVALSYVSRRVGLASDHTCSRSFQLTGR